ncbi:MAG: ABC transporter ATP-binding protein, partial [bacterium]|nr:ABC transporter ATP-binding protein [bacterium]
LLNRPKLLLADEPTGNLDADSGAIVLNYMREFASSGGAVLMVTHDSDAAGKADRIIELNNA